MVRHLFGLAHVLTYHTVKVNSMYCQFVQELPHTTLRAQESSALTAEVEVEQDNQGRQVFDLRVLQRNLRSNHPTFCSTHPTFPPPCPPSPPWPQSCCPPASTAHQKRVTLLAVLSEACFEWALLRFPHCAKGTWTIEASRHPSASLKIMQDAGQDMDSPLVCTGRFPT